jgi:Nucleotidyltransferase domain
MGIAFGAKQVILFGSTARGTNTPNSDLGFLLVIPDQTWKWHGTTLEKLEPAAKARDAFHNAGTGFQWRFCHCLKAVTTIPPLCLPVKSDEMELLCLRLESNLGWRRQHEI